MADNIIINANTPMQATMRTTNTAGVHTPHSMAEIWVNSSQVTNTNAIPVLTILANGVPVVSGSNAFPVIDNNSANLVGQAANLNIQVANVAAQVANGMHFSNSQAVSNTSPVPVSQLDAGSLGTGTFNRGATGQLFNIETTGYDSISVQVTNSGNGSTVTYLGSDDNATWVTLVGSVTGSGGSGNPTTNTTSNAAGLMTFSVKPRYFQANVSTFVGTPNVQGTYVLRKAPHFSDSIYINNSNTHAVPVNAQLLNTAGSFEAERGNIDSSANVLTFTTSNTSANSANQINYSHKGLVAYLSVTANSGAVSGTINVYNVDPVSGMAVLIANSATQANLAVANSISLQVHPGLTASGNAANALLSRTFKVGVVFAGTGNITGALTYSLIR